jgi:hypothetical protein
MDEKAETHRLQEDPPEGARDTIERELRRQENRRETGVRKPARAEPEDVEVDPHGETDASLPDSPEPYGLTEGVEKTQENARQSGGVGSVAKPAPPPERSEGATRTDAGWGGRTSKE